MASPRKAELDVGMNHLGYILYISLLIVIYTSPLIAFLLYRGWQHKRFAYTLLSVVVGVSGIALLIYAFMRLGP